MKEEILVVGAGMTRFGRLLDRSLKSLVAEAVLQALKDANCQAIDIEAAFFSNTTQSIIEGQHLIRGQIALREIGIESVPIVNVENACASGIHGLLPGGESSSCRRRRYRSRGWRGEDVP